MPRRRKATQVATLWQLAFDDDRLSCTVYRAGSGLEMRLETRRGTVMTQPFELGPRMLARMQALRRSLERHGWHNLDAR